MRKAKKKIGKPARKPRRSLTKGSRARLRRPNFLEALEKLRYPESAGLAVLRGMEV